jgi:hypothetical protein
MAKDPKPPNGEAPEPKPRGGARRHRVSEKSLANLRKWAPGESGNPAGKSSSLNEIMRLARATAPEAIETLRSIMANAKAADRDRIAACIALLDRGCGKPVVPVYRGANGLPQEMVEGVGGDGEMTALLGAAGRGPLGAYRKALADELARLDAQEREERERRRDEVDAARRDQAAGRELPPSLRMLLATKDE